MPLVRYEVRCEHSLANPELYRTAARDDSEGLLEGVAMAGLVGIVRQLGDMAEFAAEIFQDLHDDIMAIVSRGQHLKTRVTRLEANLPAVEKTLLAEASQYKFAYSARSKWRAPLPMDQNLCTQAELPRFVRNFYDDCRGPPRLFLLDKFDEAGRGACVKRYTDPTFFKLVWATSQLEKAEQVRRERESEQLKRSSATDKGLNSNGPKIYARERLSSALFENLEGFTGDFTLDLRSRRLDRVLEIPTEGELTPDGSRSPAEPRSPERSFQKRQLPEVAEGPVLAPLKISVKDIENAKLGRRILRLNNGELSDEEEESSADFYVDALTTMGSDADSEPDSRTRWDAEVQSRFAMESDQVTALNHSVLKAHVESHRHTPPSGSDDLDHNDVFARRLGLKEPGSPVAGSDTVGESKDSAESRGRQPSVEDEASRSSHGGRPSIEDAESRFADESIANEAFTSEEDARDGHAIVPENVHEDPLLLLEPSDVVPNTLPEKHPDKLSDVLPNKPADKLPAKLFERLPIKSANKLADKTTYQSHESVSLQEVYRASAKVKELKQRASAEATVQPPVLDNKLPEPRKDKQLALVNVEQTVVTPRSRRLWAKDNSSQLQTGGILSLGDNIERRGASLRLNGGSELSNLLRARMLGGSGHFHEETTNSREIVLHEEQDQFVKLPALRTGYEVTFRSSSSSTSSPYTNVSSSDVVEGDDGGYTSSASSSPKGPNFCALLSPPESPPRVAGGLMGSPAAYNTNPHFGSREITKLTLPVTPFLSISPTVSRSPSLDQDLSVSLGDELPQNYSAEAGSGPQAAPQRISPPQRHNTLGSSLAPQTRNGPVASLADSDKLKNAPVTESGSSNENGCLQVEPNRSQFSTLPNPVPRPRTWVDRSESNVAATLRAIRQAAALESDQDDDTGSECRSDC